MIKKTPKIGKIVKYDGCKVYLSKLIYEKNIRSNGEFYIDNIFNDLIDLNIKIFCVDKYHCWGTPEDLNNYLREIL